MLEVFTVARKRRKFTEELRAEVMQLVKQGGKPVAQVRGSVTLAPFWVTSGLTASDSNGTMRLLRKTRLSRSLGCLRAFLHVCRRDPSIG